ncbi:MAG TPA: YIP1 family protein [Terriglobia bacterium]|nr:YIP1 family protein [Terriglobia bacterium]
MADPTGSLIDRMVRAALLDSKVYEEVEQDERATLQAMTVVIVSSVAAGAGAYRGGGVPAMIFVALAALVGWVVWAVTVYLIGTRLLPEAQTKSNLGEMMRTTGFSSSPGVIRILGLIPGLGVVTVIGTWLWMLATMVIAVRQALDYQNTSRAIAVCVLGWLLWIILMMLAGPGPFTETAAGVSEFVSGK